MAASHHHSHAHGNAHGHAHDTEHLSDGRLIAAIALNLLLTVAEVVGGVVSGSLALLADALHNFNDCGALVIALVARRIARRPADRMYTFGYRRAETIGALINLTVLVVVGLFLLYEAATRAIYPREVEGWIVVIVAGVSLVVDVGTALLLLAMAKGSLNLRAAFLHNVADALASVGVILVGVAVILWEWYLLDVVLTVVIAGYILWQSLSLMRQTVHVLMSRVPHDIDFDQLVAALETVEGVDHLHHVHLWPLDEQHRSLEAHVVVAPGEAAAWVRIKRELKLRLGDEFAIHHSTLELELHEEQPADCADRSVVPKH